MTQSISNSDDHHDADIDPHHQRTCDLVVDHTYVGGRSGHAGDDPLPDLIGVSNQGGFRYLGSEGRPRLIVLTSKFADTNWPDEFDERTGVLTYYGDNKKPGRKLHDTPRGGNRILRNIFAAIHDTSPDRCIVPPILVFRRLRHYRDVQFIGVAVPGVEGMAASEDLVAIWRSTSGNRFQNYRARLTVLDVPVVPRSWLNDIRRGVKNSVYAPDPWVKWQASGSLAALQSAPTLIHLAPSRSLYQSM